MLKLSWQQTHFVKITSYHIYSSGPLPDILQKKCEFYNFMNILRNYDKSVWPDTENIQDSNMIRNDFPKICLLSW